MLSAESATTTLSQLREMGVQLYVDDFGTAYSLNRLHSFPIDALKIDRLCQPTRDSEGSVENCGRLSLWPTISTMDVIAEGVETAEQAQRLKILGVSMLKDILGTTFT